jgi:hypothetical protein
MKFHSAAAVAACLLLGDVSSVFGEGDGQIKLQKTETVERDILRDSQLSISPTPGRTSPIRPPTPRPTRSPTTRATFRPTENPTTLPPVIPDDEECELQVSKLIISNTCH